VLERAAEIVHSYDVLVTLRQLFYRLVSEELLRNTRSHYKTLSARTAEARREGWFPALYDGTRWIREPQSFAGTGQAREWLHSIYRRDRTEGQEHAVYIGVEKVALAGLIESWFSERGIPVLPLGGYTSQSFISNDVAPHVQEQERPSVLLYAGDFDPSGEDIDRDFIERTGCFDQVVRVGLLAEQVTAYDLPPQMGKAEDSRSSAFMAKHGELVQVELDALPVDALRDLYEQALEPLWDTSKYDQALRQEQADLEAL